MAAQSQKQFKADACIRRAMPSESAALTALARRAKSYWPAEPDVLRKLREALTISSESIRNGIFLVHEVDGRPQAVGGIALIDGTWELEHLWVEPRDMGHGIGRKLFFALCREANLQGIKELVFTSDRNAEGFYLRNGAVRIGHRPSTVIAGRELPLLRIRTDNLAESPKALRASRSV